MFGYQVIRLSGILYKKVWLSVVISIFITLRRNLGGRGSVGLTVTLQRVYSVQKTHVVVLCMNRQQGPKKIGGKFIFSPQKIG